jgi:hypothetical protein
MPEVTCGRKGSSHPYLSACPEHLPDSQMVYNLFLNQPFVAIDLERAMVNHGLSSVGAESTGMLKRVERQSSATVRE